jgi:hypothetical protein
MLKLLVFIVVGSTFSDVADAQTAGEIIKVHMKKLQDFVGTWKAQTTFHLRAGRTRTETGPYQVSWALDGRYQQWNLELQNDSTQKTRFMMILVTFNNDSSRYEVNYFYAGWPIKVFETGILSRDNSFLTSAFIPLEDGKHDEYVKTITKLISSDQIEYLHFSRFDYEKAERKDFEAKLTRVK